MLSFLVVLAFAPVLWGSAWMYMSPLPRLDGHTLVKAIIRIVLVVAILGGLWAQLNYLVHHVPLKARSYGNALLVIEGIPMLLIMFYRDYHNRSIRGGKCVNRTEGNEKKDNSHPIAPVAGVQEIQTGFSANGVLQVMIGPPRTPYTRRFIALEAVAGLVAILGLQLVPMHLRHQLHPNQFIVCRVMQVLSGLAVGWILAITITERTKLTVDSECLEVIHQVLNLPVSRKSFANREVVNLRYAHWQVEGRVKPIVQSGIRFEAGSRACTIGRCISESQANELIDEMRNLYPFSVAREDQV